MKPYEVELLVGEVAADGSGRNEIYHILFDGTVTDEHEHVAIGGHAEELTNAVNAAYRPGWDLATAVRESVKALSTAEGRQIEAESVEAGVLDRTRGPRRKFRRLDEDEVATILAG
jgi:proteasome alpha subunit